LSWILSCQTPIMVLSLRMVQQLRLRNGLRLSMMGT
jgi:hypothetical protein